MKEIWQPRGCNWVVAGHREDLNASRVGVVGGGAVEGEMRGDGEWGKKQTGGRKMER